MFPVTRHSGNRLGTPQSLHYGGLFLVFLVFPLYSLCIVVVVVSSSI